MHIVHHPQCMGTVHPSDDIQVSFWKPSAEELESLITGGGVAVANKRALTHQDPVVSVTTWPAIGPEVIDGLQRSTGYRCFECCAKEGQPHAEHCRDLVNAIQFAQSKVTQGSDSCEPTDGPLLSYPHTLTAVLQSDLAYMDLRTGPMVEVFRAAGYKIGSQCAAEEAFILDRVMRTVQIYGDKWARVFAAQLRVAQDVAIEKHEAAAHQKKSA